MTPKKNLLIAFITVAVSLWPAAGSVHAGIIATDTFESYALGALSSQTGGGSGFTGNWLAPATGGTANVVAATLDHQPADGTDNNGGAHALQLSVSPAASTIMSARNLAAPLANQTFYVSYLWQYAAGPGFNANSTLSLFLADTATDTGNNVINFGMRNPGSGQPSTFMVRAGTGSPVAGAVINVGGANPPGLGVPSATYQLVAQYVWSGAAYTTVNAWINPLANGGTAPPPQITLTLGSGGLSAINYVFFREGAPSASDVFNVDNLVLGTNWTDVVLPSGVSVSLTNPVSCRAFTAPASILLQATAADSNGSVTNVAFYAGTTLLANVTTAPYNYNWTGVPTGNYTLTAAATDNNGASNVSSIVNVTVTNSLAVTLTNPAAGAVFSAPATVLLQATASDNTGNVTNVAFYAGGTLLTNDATAPYSFTWTNVAPGGYALTAVAADDQGISNTSAVVNVSVVDTNALAQVQKWHPTDLAFTSTNTYVNPFTNVTHSATFTGPGGLTLTVPGFYAGGQRWIVRFSPTAVGSWTYVTTSSDTNLNNQTGALTCIANTNPLLHGTLKVDTNHVNYFIYEDGTPCFLNSFEADWLGELDFGDPNITKARTLVDMYRTNGFNGVLLQAYAYDTSWESGTTSTNDYGPPTQIIWLGSNGSPDWSRMNTNYFANFDRVIDYLYQNNITAHLMLRVYNKKVNWPPNGSSSDNLYWAYLTARYQAYPHIVWDFSKEADNEPDKAYINNTCLSIKARDAYHHLVTAHTANSYYTTYTNSACDFRTYQGGLYSSMVAARAANWPVLQSETDVGYQIGNDGGWTYGVHNSFIQTLTNELECFMAGVAVNYYYTYHSWDVVRYYEVPNGLSAYNNINTFFQGTKWSLLTPKDNLINSSGTGRHCLATPGSEYVVYLANNSNVTLTISGAPAGNSMTATWLDVVTGTQQTLANVGNGAQVFTNPWPDPALLHVTLAVPTDTTPPDVSIIAPTNGARLFANLPLTISATVTDNVAVAFAQLSLDGAYQIPAVSSAPYNFTVTNLTLGAHTFAVAGQDTAGNRATNNVNVTLIAPPAPPLTLETPGGGPQLNWSAPGFTLQQAVIVTGPWTNLVPQPASPFVLTPTNPETFYRLYWHTP